MGLNCLNCHHSECEITNKHTFSLDGPPHQGMISTEGDQEQTINVVDTDLRNKMYCIREDDLLDYINRLEGLLDCEIARGMRVNLVSTTENSMES